MHILKTALGIVAAGCLSLTTVHGAGGVANGRAITKHHSDVRRTSTGGSRIAKASNNRTSTSPRSHTSHRASTAMRRSHNQKHTASNREATRSANETVEPADVNVPVELPRRDNDNESENEAENDDQSSILFGTAINSDSRDLQSSAQNVPPP